MGGPGSGRRPGGGKGKGGGPYSRLLKNTGTDKKQFAKFKKGLRKQGMSKKGAEDVGAMYSHHFRKYK